MNLVVILNFYFINSYVIFHIEKGKLGLLFNINLPVGFGGHDIVSSLSLLEDLFSLQEGKN